MMKVSLSKLKSIAPYRIMLNSNDIVYARTKGYIDKLIFKQNGEPIFDKYGEQESQILRLHEFYLNDAVIPAKELKEFLRDKYWIQELKPKFRFESEFEVLSEKQTTNQEELY